MNKSHRAKPSGVRLFGHGRAFAQTILSSSAPSSPTTRNRLEPKSRPILSCNAPQGLQACYAIRRRTFIAPLYSIEVLETYFTSLVHWHRLLETVV